MIGCKSAIESVGEAYGPRITAHLGVIKYVLAHAGYRVTGPYDLSSDDYRWAICVKRPEQEDVDITIEIPEALQYGDDDSPYGINFGLDIVEYGGRILGGLTPFNYTDQCWVDARETESVADRWAIIAGANICEILDLI